MTAAFLAAATARVLAHASERLNQWAVQRHDMARGRHRHRITPDDVAAMVRAGQPRQHGPRGKAWSN